MKRSRDCRLLFLIFLSIYLCGCFTAIERAIEARKAPDIVKDNTIALGANKIMAEFGELGLSTTVYEQRLLVTGFLDDLSKCRRIKNRMLSLADVRRFHWFVICMTKEEQLRTKEKFYDSVLSFGLESTAKGRLFSASGVSDVNFRVAADPRGNLYLLGRARSEAERKRAIAALRSVDGVREIYSYVEVRP